MARRGPQIVWFVALSIAGAGCLGGPELEEGYGEARSAEGIPLRLVYRNRGWAEGRPGYQLYAKIPWVSDGSIAVMGLRLALPSYYSSGQQPVDLISVEAATPAPNDLGIAIFHRPSNLNPGFNPAFNPGFNPGMTTPGVLNTAHWQPVRCDPTQVNPANPNDVPYFDARSALIDIQGRELELIPVRGGVRDSGFEAGQVGRSPQVQGQPVPPMSFQQCQITEPNPEFAIYVFPSSGPWDAKVPYDVYALCDGEACPAYLGDPNEPRTPRPVQPWVQPYPTNQYPQQRPGQQSSCNGLLNCLDILDGQAACTNPKQLAGNVNLTSLLLGIEGTHTTPSELQFSLRTPQGQAVPVQAAATLAQQRTVPYSGTLQGSWSLCVQDTIRNGSTGRITNWTLAAGQGGAVIGGAGVNQSVIALQSGFSRNDNIEINASDWFSIQLAANQTLSVTTAGSCLQGTGGASPVVSIHSTLPAIRPTESRCQSPGSVAWNNASTVACAEDNNTTDGYCPGVATYRANVAGTYYIRVFTFENNATYAGSYTITPTVQ